MMRKITIEIDDGADVDSIYENIWSALDKTCARNLDALHDILSEYGDGVTIIVKNGEKTPENVKRVFEDLQGELLDFKVFFEDSAGLKPESGKPSFGKRLGKTILCAIVAVIALGLWRSCR